MHHLSIDLETYSSVPIAKAGAQKYISSPDFEILLFAYSVDGAPVEIIDLARGERLPPWLVQAITSPEYIKHAYNAPFEWGCLSKFLGTLPPDQWRCTMFHGLYCGYTAGLDATGKALGLAEDKRKLNTGKALIRYFCVPCAPTKANGGRTRNLPQHDTDKWELFKEYCRQDVVTEMEIERRLSAFPVPDFVQKQWETDLIINARGVAVDMDLVSGALYLGNVTRQNLTKEAMNISKLDNPNSVAQLTQWLQEAMGEELADLRKDTVARLLGAPPGYLGHDEGGQLTEAVRRRPYSVVLFDEIEKAHPDIQNILLQLLEDGQLTDAMGRKADFRNTIVLLTSNLGARFLAGQSTPLGFAAGSEAVFEKQSAQAIEEAKKWFRPELVGRLDELIVFRPLAEDSLCAIAEKLLGQLEARAARNGYQLTHTPRVGAVLAARARSPYGARELRRQVDRAVEQALANQIASGTAHTGQHWTADCTVDGAIVLEEGEVVEQTIG